MNPYPLYLCKNTVPIDPNIQSLGYGEWKCLSWVQHVRSEEKYEWVMLKFVIMCFNIFVGNEYWVFFGYLYLCISHMTSISNVWGGGSKYEMLGKAWWYCAQSHWSLCVVMVCRCLPS